MAQAQQAKAQKITPRAKDFSEWYGDVIAQAQLADYSPVRGCMVIRPHGYRIWELMQRALDDMFRTSGHRNAYFPLFIPMSFLAKEAEHVEGFAKEVALVTHTRLRATGKEGAAAIAVDPTSALEEPLVVRPTSETIIYAMFAKWIQSYRDLPLLLNQWCNVVRWELRTRLFLRTTEFLWQEGHTAHADEPGAEQEARLILGIYRRFAEEWMAMPVITGVKTESERFAGALRTYAIEALMQDNKALQAGTSHNLGQNFAKAFNVQFQTAAGGLDYVWNTSWGVSTRLIGGVIMTHSDDNGLVAPPKLAPVQVAIVPIWKSDDERTQVSAIGSRVKTDLEAAGVRVELDLRDTMKPGAKYFEWEALGAPVRLEIGPRDVASGQAVLARRTGGKAPTPLQGIKETVIKALDEIQAGMLNAARERREQNSTRGVTKTQFIELMQLASGGGFAYGGFCGSPSCEAEIKAQTGATIRVLPDPEFRSKEAPRTCMWCGAPSVAEAVWAQAY
jgi:prolyl-tRNA synthetase